MPWKASWLSNEKLSFEGYVRAMKVPEKCVLGTFEVRARYRGTGGYSKGLARGAKGAPMVHSRGGIGAIAVCPPKPSQGALFAPAEPNKRPESNDSSGCTKPSCDREKAENRGNSGYSVGKNGASEDLLLEKLWRVCGEFEGMFLAQIMRIMNSSVLKSDFLHAGIAEEIFVDQFCMAVGREAGKQGSLGIAKLLYERLAPIVRLGQQTGTAGYTRRTYRVRGGYE